MFKSMMSKMTLLFTALSVLVVIIAGLAFTALFANTVRDEQKEAMESCAKNIAQLISKENMLSTFDRTLTLPEQIASAQGYKVWVCSAAGVFFLTGKDNNAPSNLNNLEGAEKHFVEGVLEGYHRIGNDFNVTFEGNYLSVGIPVVVATSQASNEVVGAVILHGSTENYDRLLGDSYLYIFVVVLFAIAVFSLCGIWFTGQITRPLKCLSEVSAEMSRGNYDIRVEFLNQPELNTIGESLNSLALTTKNSVSDIKRETSQVTNIIENMSDGIAVYDLQFRLIRYNSALLNLCEEDYFQRDEIKTTMYAVLESGTTKNVNLEFKNKILSFTISPIKEGEKPRGLIAVVNDITERERLEQTRREFVSNVSHEFRTPLTIIRGAVELLMDGVLDSEESKMECYQKIDSESQALSNLVRDLLDTSRMKSGKIKIEPRAVDLNALLNTLTSNMQDIANNKQIRINYEPVDIPPVWGDELRLRQLVIIFIDNAIKFTPVKGVITVSVYTKSNKAYLCVKDTGVGISKEDQPYLFERFYKVDKARGGSETGTGLGLSIAWQIAKLHKGTILIESEPGKGTTFKTVLPLAEIEEGE